MILTGHEITMMYNIGRIHISSFNEKHVGPNSYDLRLSNLLLIYAQEELDMGKENPTVMLQIPDEGRILYPGELYLGSTVEECGSDEFVCCIEGRSSTARLGISIHLTAGFGDCGFKSRWTLEITVAKPIRIYPNVRICQAMFYLPQGKISKLYKGKYSKQDGPVASRMYKDFTEGV
jgi:dCTP deaminase